MEKSSRIGMLIERSQFAGNLMRLYCSAEVEMIASYSKARPHDFRKHGARRGDISQGVTDHGSGYKAKKVLPSIRDGGHIRLDPVDSLPLPGHHLHDRPFPTASIREIWIAGHAYGRKVRLFLRPLSSCFATCFSSQSPLHDLPSSNSATAYSAASAHHAATLQVRVLVRDVGCHFILTRTVIKDPYLTQSQSHPNEAIFTLSRQAHLTPHIVQSVTA
jgi:hypothetical protein